MDKTRREELEKAYRKEKDSRMVPGVPGVPAVHTVRVRRMSVGKTAANLMRPERRVHKRAGHPRTGQKPSKGCYGRTKQQNHLLSKGSPHLNAIGECRRWGKQVLLVSEYHRTFADLRNAIITYHRTVRFKLDIFKFAHGKATALCTN